ncbi:helix-turn-helix domain-containing protein [Sulfobacillus thermosulfidooxidans]|uniref:helix-turn-helix domain-containing protein n=1 Tax=Sulfobacillus thermosulfidooxidans TaxID=28034 RepID=UPI0006B493FE
MQNLKINILDSSTWPEFLTVQEVCQILRTSRNTVYNLIALEQLQSLRLGTTHRIPKDSLLQFIEREEH